MYLRETEYEMLLLPKNYCRLIFLAQTSPLTLIAVAILRKEKMF
jgi:hypothetical protein